MTEKDLHVREGFSFYLRIVVALQYTASSVQHMTAYVYFLSHDKIFYSYYCYNYEDELFTQGASYSSNYCNLSINL